MNDKEYRVERGHIEVRRQEARVQEVRKALKEGTNEAAAKYNREILKLEADLNRELIQLDLEKSYLRQAEDEAARGFEQ